MLLWLLAGSVAFAGPRGEARSLLADGRWEEASGVCRAELVLNPERSWALRCATEATEQLVGRELELANEAADAVRLDAALAHLESARRLVRQAGVSGVDVPIPSDAEGRLRSRAASASLSAAARAETSGDWAEAVQQLRGALALLGAGEADVVGRLAEALRQVARAEEGTRRAEVLEEVASLTGEASDAEAAVEAWAAVADALEARGDLRGATEAWARALPLDASREADLRRVEALARTEVVVRVKGGDKGLATAFRAGLRAALQSRGSRFLQVVSRPGAARIVPGPNGPVEVPASSLVVTLDPVQVDQGEVSHRRVTRPHGSITKVVKEGTLVVAVRLEVGVVLSMGERKVRTRLHEALEETARWDGPVTAVRTPIGRKGLKSGPSGERAPAVREAKEHATSAAVTRLVSTVAAEVLRQVDRADPPVAPPSSQP